VHAAPTIPSVHEIGRAAEELVFLSVQFLFSALERRETRVKPRFDRDQVLIGQRTNPRQVDAFRYDSHLNLLIRHYVAYRPACIFFDEK
jgi:hypothetical protein